MQIKPANRTHAQNRFIRRLQNKHDRFIAGGGVGLKGSPIPGPLTPVEIAHKARRRARRLFKAQSSLKSLPFKISSFETELLRLEALPTPEDSKGALEHTSKISFVCSSIIKLESELTRQTRILSALS